MAWRPGSLSDRIGRPPGSTAGLDGGPQVPLGDRISVAASPSTLGGRPARSGYAQRDAVETTNSVTRRMAGTVHERVDRIEQGKDWFGRIQDRLQGRPLRPIRIADPRTGESFAKWALGQVLNARKRPVPSFGFSLAPILTHAVAARRQQRFRAVVLLIGLGWLTASHPRGAMASLAVLVLWQFLAGPRGRAVLRWALRSIVSFLLTAAAAYGLWIVVRPRLPGFYVDLRSAEHFAAEALLVAAITYALDRLASHAYMQSLRPSRAFVATRPLFAPIAAKKIDNCRTAEMWQTIPYRTEDGADRFVGAGLDAWRPGATRIQLAPAKTAEEREEDAEERGEAEYFGDGFRKFEADELLDRVLEELQDLRGVLVETHALPNCDVAEFLGVPQGRWPKLIRWPQSLADPAWPESVEMCNEARQPPTGHPSRRYLAAQVVSWDGQLVVTVFVHAALEGKTLHFVTRPHVIAPLSGWADGEPAKGRELAAKLALVPVHACGDVVALGTRMYFYLGRGLALIPSLNPDAPPAPEKDDGLPISLREHCGRAAPADMHQREDATRYVDILQARMFSTVRAFLADHGLATGEFLRQVVQIQNFINGDHNQVNTGNVNGGMHNSAPQQPAPTKEG